MDICETLENIKETIAQDLNELEKFIFPKYQKSEDIIKSQKADQCKNSKKLTADMKNQKEALLKEIDAFIQSKQIEIDVMDSKHQIALDKQEDAINHTLTEIKQVIQDLKSLLDTSDDSIVLNYKSRIEKFRKVPSKFRVTLPKFLPYQTNRDQLLQQFGSLTALSIETEEQGDSVLFLADSVSPPGRPMLDFPRLITDIPTIGNGSITHVSCLTDEEIWIIGNDEILNLYNMQGDVLRSVQTKSGNRPEGIAVTRSGDLLYADYDDRSINLVSGTQVESLITLQGWKPRGLCSTSSGDLLVIMDSEDVKQTKVVRYTDSKEKQTIDLDDKARAVVVVNAAGKLRFRYTGFPSIPQKFYPFGITTDSQANILIADFDDNCIHIIDQNGKLLHYMYRCRLQVPWGLCVDSKDNLLVAEWVTGKVKKIKYYK
ncbi:uncharacterized protein LOC111132774 [Crassostrea virginica]